MPEFRAPPPSPVTGVLTGSSSGSSGYGECHQDDDDIGRFLRCSTRVPVLRLPERPGPRRNKKAAAWAPPVVDMRLLHSLSSVEGGGGSAVEALRSAAVAFGCFQVVGHGVDASLLSAAFRAARSEGSPALETEGIRAGDEDELWWLRGEGDQEMAGTQPLRNGPNQFIRYVSTFHVNSKTQAIQCLSRIHDAPHALDFCWVTGTKQMICLLSLSKLQPSSCTPCSCSKPVQLNRWLKLKQTARFSASASTDAAAAARPAARSAKMTSCGCWYGARGARALSLSTSAPARRRSTSSRGEAGPGSRPLTAPSWSPSGTNHR